MNGLIKDKRELAEIIMAHAIERVHKLGFRMKVGSKSGTAIKVELGAMNLFYYSTEADGAPVAEGKAYGGTSI